MLLQCLGKYTDKSLISCLSESAYLTFTLLTGYSLCHWPFGTEMDTGVCCCMSHIKWMVPMCTQLLFPPFNLHCLHASLSNETAEMSVFPKAKYTAGGSHTHPLFILYVWLQVLDAGRIQEYDEPYVLLQNHDGLFYQMVQQTGRAEAASLLHTAKQVAWSTFVPGQVCH